MTEDANTLPELTPHQARVFACLIEKHLSTPKNYPLTINSLVLACNQKSNRSPVMSLSEGQVSHVVNELVELQLARIDYGSRTNKVMHRKGELNINREEAAVLCMLMLREPLTFNDIKARTEKMVAFENVEALELVVNELLTRESPLLVQIPKSSGRRENRYSHTLCGEVVIDLESPLRQETGKKSTAISKNDNAMKNDLQVQVNELEQRLVKVEALLNELSEKLDTK